MGSEEMFPEIVRRFDAIHKLAVGMPERFAFARVSWLSRTEGMNQPEAPTVSLTFPCRTPPETPDVHTGVS